MLNTIREIYDYRAMIQSLVKRDLRGKYLASVLGFLWTFILPLCQLLIYTAVFSLIMRAGIEKFYLYLFVALIPWNFCATSLTGGANSVINQQAMVTKIYFPREVLPIAYTTGTFVNMLYCYIVVFAVCLFSGVHFHPLGLMCLPIVMVVEYIFVLGLVMIFSAVTVYLRDLEHILNLVAMAWMFMTPIMYTMEQVPEKLRFIFRLNPMTGIVQAYRSIMYYGQVPHMEQLFSSVVVGIVFLFLGFFVFGKLKIRFAEEM